MAEDSGRPVLALLTSHWLSLVGAALATIAGSTWLVMLPTQLRGHASNPYIGIALFVVLPILFVLALLLIPLGLWLARRRIREGATHLPDKRTALRRVAIFLAVTTIANIIIVSQLSYRAVAYMETRQFCGQSCHVMKPEFTAHQAGPHAELECVDCHVAPGAAGWVESKMAGTRQLIEVVFNSYPRPIKSAMETNRLVAAEHTCQRCHWTEKYTGERLRVIPEYADDEKNTLTQTVLMMKVGGGHRGGIHGAHFGPGVSIRYAPTSSKRDEIPVIEYENTAKNLKRTYVADGSKPEDNAKLARYQMQCVDCHNRPAHTFDTPERAMNRAMALGEIPVTLPFVKKKGVELLKATYTDEADAAHKIPDALRAYYKQAHPAEAQARSADIDRAAAGILAIYNKNVFPDLKVSWGTYTNNLGHTDYPGCFRCHDEGHQSADKQTVSQDCTVCHEMLAASEASPEILKTLGLDEKLASLQRK